MSESGTSLLVTGYSTRAIAESAARSGFRVTSIDAFADLDQHPGVTALALPDFTPSAAAARAREVRCNAVAYVSSFENHPDAVQQLACGRTLLGNSPDVLRRVRNPVELVEALARRALPTARLDGSCDSLLKPIASGGGTRIRRWDGGAVPADCYVQEFIAGVAGSVIFLAARGEIQVLGVSRQLIGLDAFGASGFRYCGTILGSDWGQTGVKLGSDEGQTGVRPLAHAVAAEFGLVGINGIDFIRRDGRAVAIEVNPRWSASVELVERACGVSLFDAHATACVRGQLPDLTTHLSLPANRSYGKAIVFATHDVTIGDTTGWAETRSVRDIPRPGSTIRCGEPVCTVFADAPAPDACLAALEAAARTIYAELDTFARADI